MNLEDAKEGVRVEFQGKTRIVVIDNKKNLPKIRNGIAKKKQKWSWDYSKWNLVGGEKSKNKSSKPTIHLIWKKHSDWSSFDTHFKEIEKSKNQTEKLSSSQGWYCLGSKDHIGYIGLVGQVHTPKDGKRKQSENTFRRRWNNEHDAEDLKSAKFPKGYFKRDKIKIKSKPARLYTSSITAARKFSTDEWQPTLLKRNITQGSFIEEIEGCIIVLAALKNKDFDRPLSETKKFYKQKGRGWQGGKDKPVAFSFPGTKTMVNYRNVKNLSDSIRLNGEFNIKFSGDMPKNLSKIFSEGIYLGNHV
jgi:hypothetical protein